MTIRRQLLYWLIPPLIFFVLLISCFFYLKWWQEIRSSFQSHLRSIVMTASQSFSADSVDWLATHRNDPDVMDHPFFQDAQAMLFSMEQQLPPKQLYLLGLTGERDNQQRVVLLSSNPKNHEEGEKEILLSSEATVYRTKKPLVTPPYKKLGSDRPYLTAYAPILDKNHDVVGLFGADASLGAIEKEKQRALLIIALGSFIGIAVMVLSVTFVANKIIRPIRRLNAAALAIASGEYGERITVSGPREVHELAKTLSTLSECLDETLSRLQEASFTRERMFGEYECSLLLQQHMLNKPLDRVPRNKLLCDLLKSTAGSPSRNLLFDVLSQDMNDFRICISEARKTGFAPLFELLHAGKEIDPFPHAHLSFTDDFHTFSFTAKEMAPMFHWSQEKGEIHKINESPLSLESKDILFFVNSSFVKQFSHWRAIESWFGKVLRHFAMEGISVISTILRNELHFLTKKNPTAEDLIVLSFQRR